MSLFYVLSTCWSIFLFVIRNSWWISFTVLFSAIFILPNIKSPSDGKTASAGEDRGSKTIVPFGDDGGQSLQSNRDEVESERGDTDTSKSNFRSPSKVRFDSASDAGTEASAGGGGIDSSTTNNNNNNNNSNNISSKISSSGKNKSAKDKTRRATLWSSEKEISLLAKQEKDELYLRFSPSDVTKDELDLFCMYLRTHGISKCCTLEYEPANFREGEVIEGNFQRMGKWEKGKISRDRGDGTYDITYDISHDRNNEPEEEEIPEELIRRSDERKLITEARPYAVDDEKKTLKIKSKSTCLKYKPNKFSCGRIFSSSLINLCHVVRIAKGQNANEIVIVSRAPNEKSKTKLHIQVPVSKKGNARAAMYEEAFRRNRDDNPDVERLAQVDVILIFLRSLIAKVIADNGYLLRDKYEE